MDQFYDEHYITFEQGEVVYLDDSIVDWTYFWTSVWKQRNGLVVFEVGELQLELDFNVLRTHMYMYALTVCNENFVDVIVGRYKLFQTKWDLYVYMEDETWIIFSQPYFPLVDRVDMMIQFQAAMVETIVSRQKYVREIDSVQLNFANMQLEMETLNSVEDNSKAAIPLHCESEMNAKEFAKSKFSSKVRNNRTVLEKEEEKIQYVRKNIMGSRKKKILKKLQKRIKASKIQLHEESMKLDNMAELLEKALGLYLLQYKDKPIYLAMSAALLLFRGSISTSAFNLVKSIIDDYKGETSTLGDLINWLRDMVVNLEKFKANKFAQSFCGLITKLFSTFLCPSLLSKLKNLCTNQWLDKLLGVFTSEVSPLESCLHFFTYICNAVHVFVTKGTLDGFLETETHEDVIQREVLNIENMFTLFKTGDIEYITKFKIYDLEKALSDLLLKLSSIRKSKKTVELKKIDDWVKRLTTIQSEIMRTQYQSSSKMQPYNLSLSSGSGISKTHLAKLLCTTIAVSNGFHSEEDYLYYLNQANKYQSGWKNYKTMIIVDDAAAMMKQAGAEALNLADWLLRGSNNVPHELLGAAIEEKASLYNRALVEVWASNSFDMDFQSYARRPSVLYRRFQCQIVGRVKDKYKKINKNNEIKSTMIDYSKIPEEEREDIAPDAWEFDVHKVEIADSPLHVRTNPRDEIKETDWDYAFPILEYQGKMMKNITLSELLNFISETSVEHFKQQKEVLKINKRVFEAARYCPHGIPKQCKCNRCIESKPNEVDNKSVDYKQLYSEVLKGIENPRLKNSNGWYQKKQTPAKQFRFRKDNLYIVWPVYWSRKYVTVGGEQTPTRKLSTVRVVKEGPMKNFDMGPISFLFESSDSVDRERVSIMYMKGVIDFVKEGKLQDMTTRWKNGQTIFSLLQEMFKELLDTMSTWFDDIVLEVFRSISVSVAKHIAEFMENPYAYIPSYVEGTALGALLHAKNPAIKTALAIDWISYKSKVLGKQVEYALDDWVFTPMVESATNVDLVKTDPVKPEHPVTMWVYETFLQTRTQKQRKKAKEKLGLTLEEFVMEGGMKISAKEKEIKMQDFNYLREFLLPAAGCTAVVMVFIPALCKNLKATYLTEEMGVDVTVEEIKLRDKEEQTKWYLQKREMLLPPVEVEGIATFSELENICKKNTFYVKGINGTGYMNCFSPANEFVLMPTHFVEAMMDKEIVMLKSEIASWDCVGNATVTFQLRRKMCKELYGDVTLVHVAKYMDHMRTKNLLKYFPKTWVETHTCGNLLTKNSLGKVKRVPVKNITRNEVVCIENNKEFEAYIYEAATCKGMCGAPLVDGKHKKSFILGIHVLGSGRSDGEYEDAVIASSCPVFRDELEKAMKAFNVVELSEESMPWKQLDEKGFTKQLHIKSPFLDTVDKLEGCEIFGSITERTTPTAKVVDTPIKEDVLKEFEVEFDWSAPNFRFDGDKKHGERSLIRIYSDKKVFNRGDLLDLAVKDFRNRINEPMSSEYDFWKEEIRLLTDFEVVNGVSGKRFLGGMNMSSRCSFDRPGKKSNYATLKDGVWTLDESIWKEFYEFEKDALNNVFRTDLVVQCLKNEATPMRKVLVGKVRSFFMYGIHSQMLLRKYLLTTCRYWCLRTEYTECAVGINPHSPDWDGLMSRIIDARRYIIALDLKNFDIQSHFEVIEEGMDLIFEPLRKVGLYTKYQGVFNCIKHMLLYTICDVNGDIVSLSGIIPSGTNLTSILGSTVNALNMRLAYYFCFGKSAKPFHTGVYLKVFSDDVIGSVDKTRKEFSVKRILQAWKEMGINGTDMDKNVESDVEFYKKEDVEFLKRKARYDSHFKSIVAPLSKESMFKMLCCHIPPKSMTIEAITGQCLDNFLFEAKFHGKKFYNKAQSILLKIAKKHNLEHYTNGLEISFEAAVQEWKDYFSDKQVTRGELTFFQQSLRHLSELLEGTQDWFEWTPNYEERKEIIDKNPRVFKREFILDRVLLHQESQMEKEQVVDFDGVKREPSVAVGTATKDTRSMENVFDIKRFMQRPVKIYSTGWGNTDIGTSFDPWDALLKTEEYADKWKNFPLFKADLKIKAVVNGNGFYYGSAMVSYLPNSTIDSQNRVVIPFLLNETSRLQLSNMPNFMIDPTMSKGGEMLLPYTHFQDYIDLRNNAYWNIGTIFITQIVQLLHANQDIVTSGSTVTVTFYAWFENIILKGATQKPVSLSFESQMCEHEAETPKKSISQLATNVANAASIATQVPVIGPYATAAETGARMVSSVAESFGFSAPTIVQESTPYQPRLMGNMATTNVASTCLKLSTDVKQELAIDPTEWGAKDEDEMSILTIASKYTYIDTFFMTTTQVPGTHLFSVRVTPQLYKTDAESNVFMTAACGAVYPFQYYAPDDVFKFQVISSGFHRARLLFVYDPVVGSTTPKEHLAFTEVVNIEENREFEIRLGNYQSKSWIETVPLFYANPVISKTTPFTTEDVWSNGVLSVYILNGLTTPSSDPSIGNTIAFNVFHKCGPNFKVANPTNRICTMTKQVPLALSQEAMMIPDEMDDGIKVDHSVDLIPQLNKLYIGEEITSFRTLLKRYNAYSAYLADTDGGLVVKHQMYPIMKGEALNFPMGAETTLTTMLSYVRSGFAFSRGSVRWKIRAMSSSGTPCTLTASRAVIDNLDSAYVSAAVEPFVDAGSFIEGWLTTEGPDSLRGSMLSSTSVNPSLDFELPFYSQYKYVPGRPYIFSSSAAAKYCDIAFRVTFRHCVQSTRSMMLEFYVAAGEDFTTSFFVGWPGFQP